MNRVEPEAKIVKYKAETNSINIGVFVDKNDIIKEVSTFIRFIREYFYDICMKAKLAGRVYTKI